MIRPSLLTASTNKADHLGTSGAGLVACRCIGSVLLSLRVVLVLRTGVFPLRSDVRTRVGAQPTPQGGTEWSTQSEVASWRLGSRGRIRAQKGETKSKFSRRDGAKRNIGEALLIHGVLECARTKKVKVWEINT